MALSLLKDVLTPQWLKDSYLQGIVLTDLVGQPFPDSLYSDAIAAAVKHVEALFDLRIVPFKIGTERYAMREEQGPTRWQFALRRRPIRSIESLRIRYGAIKLIDIPLEWIYQVHPLAGILHILPTQANIQIAQVPVPSLWALGDGYLPGGFEFSYTSGFVLLSGTVAFLAGETTKTITLPETLWETGYDVQFTLLNPQPADAAITGSVSVEDLKTFEVTLSAAPANNVTVQWILYNLPADLKMFIGLKASLQPLNVAGTTLLPPGYASGSRSEDGLSESLTSTQNSQQLAYGNRRDAHQLLIDQLMPTLRGRYRALGISIQ